MGMMSAEKSSDDVIRIRVDTGLAVQDFLDLLAEQAAAGETCAPANPANRAVFRELAPYRLVEYAYVDGEIGAIDGVYLGFSDGALYAVTDEIPEEQVDALVRDVPAEMAPVYVYVVLAEAQAPERIDHFMAALAHHVDKPVVGIFRDAAGIMTGHAYDGGDVTSRARLDSAVVKSVLEANLHLSKQRVLERYAARAESPDGRAWAQITYNFAKHVVEFASPAERNDFMDWSRTLCEWIYARWCSWEDLGFAEIMRPAEVAPAPKGEIVAVRLNAPAKAQDGRPWQAFGGTNAATAKTFSESPAAASQEALRQSLYLAREYWSYCKNTIDSAEFVAKKQAEAHAKRQF
ncbi:MAG: hypothetical protein H7Z12_01135 [Rhodospirillaceae bacterium]|nr:hypothetical protein [Rhodospirillales bacterium]